MLPGENDAAMCGGIRVRLPSLSSHTYSSVLIVEKVPNPGMATESKFAQHSRMAIARALAMALAVGISTEALPAASCIMLSLFTFMCQMISMASPYAPNR